MRNNLHLFVCLLVFWGLIVTPTMGYAGSKGYRPRFYELAKKVSKQDMFRVYEQMKLSDDQKTSLEKNREKHHAAGEKLKKEMRQLKQKLKDELAEPELDEKKISDLKSKINTLQSKLTDLRVNGIMGVRQILSPKQYQLFDQETR